MVNVSIHSSCYAYKWFTLTACDRIDVMSFNLVCLVYEHTSVQTYSNHPGPRVLLTTISLINHTIIV
jgi:hypothetical protein